MYYPMESRITALTTIRRERLLPASGQVLVGAGETVSLRVSPRIVRAARSGLPGCEVIDHTSTVVQRVASFEEPTTVSYSAEARGLNALVVKGQRSWYLWIARSDHLPWKLKQIVRVSYDIIMHEQWSNMTVM